MVRRRHGGSLRRLENVDTRTTGDLHRSVIQGVIIHHFYEAACAQPCGTFNRGGQQNQSLGWFGHLLAFLFDYTPTWGCPEDFTDCAGYLSRAPAHGHLADSFRDSEQQHDIPRR